VCPEYRTLGRRRQAAGSASACPPNLGSGLGVDTLSLTYSGELAPGVAERLRNLRQLAADATRGERVALQLGRQALHMSPHGAQFWEARLWNDNLDVATVPVKGMAVPEIRIRLRSSFLWAEGGVPVAVAHARLVAGDLFGPEAGTDENPVVERVSRIDLAVDWQPGKREWLPALRDLDRFVTKAAHRRADGGFQAHKVRERFTGFTFGRTPLLVRIYDKQEEIKASDKAWFRTAVWPRCPDFDPDAPVWRVEAQISRKSLKTMRFGESEQAVCDADQVLAVAPSIWSHVLGRWLRLTRRGRDTNRSRWRTVKAWRLLQEVSCFGVEGQVEGVAREHRRDAGVSVLLRQTVPMLAHAAALAATNGDRVRDVQAAVELLKEHIAIELRRRDVCFEDLVERHRTTAPVELREDEPAQGVGPTSPDESARRSATPDPVRSAPPGQPPSASGQSRCAPVDRRQPHRGGEP